MSSPSALPVYAVPVDKSPFPIPVVDCDLACQSLEVPGTRRPGQTAHYRNARFRDFTSVEDPRYNFPKTEYEVFNHGLGRSFDRPCLGRRPINPTTGQLEPFLVWQSYQEIDQRRTDLGSGLLWLQSQGQLGSDCPLTGWTVGIWTHNRPEWQIVYQGCVAYSLVVISLYETLGPQAVEYCINHSEAKVAFVSAAHMPDLLANSKACPGLKVIVSVDGWSDLQPIKPQGVSQGNQEKILKAWGRQAGIKVLDIGEVETLGRNHPSPHVPPKPSDMLSICYTSGTTGVPKGAILLHRTMVAGSVGNLHNLVSLSGEVVFSYLPLSHIYARLHESVSMAAGLSIAYSCGDNTRLLEDLQIAKPVKLIGVPRVLNRIYQAVSAQMEGPGLKKALARRALASKLERLKTTGSYTHPIWDRLIFNKLGQALGGQVQLVVSGSAPISPDVLKFFKVAFVTPVIEGYGATENAGTCTRCHPEDPDPDGTTGPPQPGQEVKLVDVPEMNYFSTDKPFPRGEICVRGEACIPGYFKDEKSTKALIDDEGWQHSGDIGLLDAQGRFKVVDRVKNLLKLSQGEYVALEKVEGAYSVNSLVGQIYVHGDSMKSHVIAVVVPEPAAFQAFANKVAGGTISPEKACQEPKIIDAFQKELDQTAVLGGLNGFERVRQIHLTMEPFTIENEMLTPTFKLKRPAVKARYEQICNELYDRFEGEKTLLKL